MSEKAASSATRPPAPIVAVIGGAEALPADLEDARRIGRALALAGVTVLTGGRGGVMEAASRGASEAGGLTVGLLPGRGADESPCNPYVRIPIYTGLNDARNAILARTAAAVVAVGGGFGTLSEIGLALKAGRPVISLRSWSLQPPGPTEDFRGLVHLATDAAEAIRLTLACLPGGTSP